MTSACHTLSVFEQSVCVVSAKEKSAVVISQIEKERVEKEELQQLNMYMNIVEVKDEMMTSA